MAENFEIASDFNFTDSAQVEAKPMTAKEGKLVERQVYKEMASTTKRQSAEEIAQKQKLILKIGRYEKSKHYGEQLKSLGFCFGKSLQSKSMEELEEQLVQMKVSLNNDPNSNMIATGLFLATGFAEQVTQNPKIKDKCDLQGWTANLRSNPEFEKIVDLLSLEYESLSTLSPETRLLLILATSGISVCATNVHISQIRKAQAEQAKIEEENRKVNQGVAPTQPQAEAEVAEEPEIFSDAMMRPNLVLQIEDEPEEELEEEPEEEEAIRPKLKLKMKNT
jgi:hypothetical protein